MRGLGTVLNIVLIAVGGIAGLLFGKKLGDKLKETLITVIGLAVTVLGISGAMEYMLAVNGDRLVASGTVLLILSLVLGGITGELLHIEDGIERFGCYLKKKTGSEDDSDFVGAFVTASCTVCIGAMAVVGAIRDGISGDYSILLTKGLMDAVVICMMAAGSGKGAVFSAIPVGVLQGLMTLVAFFAGSFLTDRALSCLSFVGSVLIFAVGLNLLRKKHIRVANLLPALIFAVGFSYIPGL